jgi:endonuclease/exonuclease/phosphatase family metal-dependent hydrolase
MKIIYSNISGGLLFAGRVYGEMLFSKVSLQHYADYFAAKKPDILSLSEVHFESEDSSEMIDALSAKLALPYRASYILSASHLDTSKKMGMAILSKFPIIQQEYFAIKSPGITVVRPNGEIWKMFDKGGLRAMLEVGGRQISVVSFSYFPFHHFNRRADEPEFAHLRKELLAALVAEEDTPTIITGDFNTKGLLVADAFSELFAGDALRQAVQSTTTVIGAQEAIDQILYQPRYFVATNSFAEENGSDHLAIGAELTLQ